MTIQNVAGQMNHPLSADSTAEPQGLRDLIPGVHQYLGDLPHGLREAFIAISQMSTRQFAFAQGDDEALTKAYQKFEGDVAHFFNLTTGTEFEILTGFKVALMSQTKAPETSGNSDSPTTSPCVCDDMASY